MRVRGRVWGLGLGDLPLEALLLLARKELSLAGRAALGAAQRLRAVAHLPSGRVGVRVGVRVRVRVRAGLVHLLGERGLRRARLVALRLC